MIEEAQGTALVDACLAQGLRVVAFDPLVPTLPNRGAALTMAKAPADVVQAADVVVVATPDPAFTALDWPALLAAKPGLHVVDAWRLLRERVPASASARYHVLGRGPVPGADAAAEARLAELWTGAAR